MATNTEINIGIRQNFITLGDRNFENSGTVQYVSNRDGLDFMAVVDGALTKYAVGATLPFDAGGPPATYYSAAALEKLELYWNQGWIKPAA